MNKEVKITLLFWLVSSLLIGEIISGYYYYNYQATMNEFSEAIALGKLMPELVGGEDKLQYIDKFFTLLDFPQWYFDYLKLTGIFLILASISALMSVILLFLERLKNRTIFIVSFSLVTIAQLFLMFISILSGVLAGYLTAMYISFVLVTCLFILYYSVKLKRHTPYLAPLHWWENRHLLVVFYGVLTLLFAYAVYYLLLNFVFGPPFPILANLFIPYLDLLPIGEISMEELSWLLVIVDGGFYSLISALVISMLVNRIKLFAIILPPALLLSLGYWLSMIGMLYFSEVIPYYLFGGFISHFSNHFVSYNSLYYVAVFHLMIIFVVNINKRKSDAMLEDCP